jgi:hypothetical protein
MNHRDLDGPAARRHYLHPRRSRRAAWRSPPQAASRLLSSPDIDIAVTNLSVARTVRLMCADAEHDDVVDIHVVLCARQRRHAIVTSDPNDIAHIDPTVPRILV